MNRDGAIPPETLLAHTGWMRRLARTLVRDDAQADDVVQDAFAAALRSPPRDPLALPAWLATSVRNAARQLWRGESRRRVREEASARPEATGGAAEVVARAEEHGLVVRAVLGLPEPHRSALLLRFFDDLPPGEVAERLGVPLETARARIRRGVAELRARLDAAHGGDGEAWRLALLPIALRPDAAATAGTATGASAGSASPPLSTGAMVMAGTGATAAVCAGTLVLGAAVGWWLGSSGERAKAEKTVADAAAQSADERRALDERIADLEAKLRRLEEQASAAEGKLRAANAELATMKAEKAAAEEAAREAAARASAAPAKPAPKGPRFAFAQFGKLNDVDWKVVGSNLSAMAPLCDAILQKLAAGEPLPPEEFGKVQQHNGALITVALKVANELPGTGANGSFTHPAFMVNAMAAALDAARMPLTDAQATAIEKLAREFSDEDARRIEDYPATTFQLQKTIDEADLRNRFFEAAFAVLTPEQRDTLTPPATKGVVGFDLFSDGLIWATLQRPLAFKENDQETLVSQVTSVASNALRIPREQQDAVRGVVARWVGELPAVLVNASETKGGQRVETLREAARQTLALSERLVADLKLEGASADAARRSPVVLVPVPQGGDDEDE